MIPLMRRLRALRKKEKAAVAVNEALLASALTDQQQAIAALAAADVQAGKLESMDARNHYSESMTYAFRGRTI